MVLLNNWKKEVGSFASTVEIEEQIVKFGGKVVLVSPPEKIPKSFTKSSFCAPGAWPSPVSITSKAKVIENKSRTRRRTFLVFIAKSIVAWK